MASPKLDEFDKITPLNTNNRIPLELMEFDVLLVFGMGYKTLY